MVCEVIASLDLAVWRYPDLRLISWTEILAKAPKAADRAGPLRIANFGPNEKAPVPDALFGIAYTADAAPRYRFFALEADRGTMPVSRTSSIGTSLLEKVASYRSYVAAGRHRAELGIPNLLVLIVTTALSRAETIRSAIERRYGESPSFLIQSVDCLSSPLPTLLAGPWTRAGCAPIAIIDPN
jgi:hypothetical protein